MEIITASRHIFDDDSIDENHESFHKEEEELIFNELEINFLTVIIEIKMIIIFFK